MKKTKIMPLLLILCLLAGCAAPASPAQTPPEQQQEPARQEQQEQQTAPDTSQVASASEMTTVQDVVEEGMTPIPASALKDGVYDAAVDCSSSMFKIESCRLTVTGGTMTASLTLGSDAYGYLYAGSAEEAAAGGVEYIEPEGRTFVLPVEALDAGVACAAWSRSKEKWYDRTLVFRADSLPPEAFAELKTAASLGLADGEYGVEATLAGGSGRASIGSPCHLWIENGAAKARIVWGSANYDYMLVDGARYDAEYDDGHSVFVIPVAAFDHPLAVVADTTAMSKPYEIDYTIRFDSASIRALAS